MQNYVNSEQKLLDESGFLANPGYATYPHYIYRRKDVSANQLRIKEWDYYAILNPKFGVSLTIADLGYLGMATIVFFDFQKQEYTTKTEMIIMPLGKLKLPESSLSGNVCFNKKTMRIEFEKRKDLRKITALSSKFKDNKEIVVELDLFDLHDESLVIATPWKESKKAFYYNQKINCIPSEGSITIGDDVYLFDKSDTLAVLDWGRGVWTYKNTWYWASMSTYIDGHRLGFNFGYGFGDTSKATENMLFYDGKAYKLEHVHFEIQDDLMLPWMIKDDQGKVDLTLVPKIDRKDRTNMGIIKNIGDQMFGLISGTIKIDQQIIEIKDALGFAEKITNHY